MKSLISTAVISMWDSPSAEVECMLNAGGEVWQTFAEPTTYFLGQLYTINFGTRKEPRRMILEVMQVSQDQHRVAVKKASMSGNSGRISVPLGKQRHRNRHLELGDVDYCRTHQEIWEAAQAKP